MLSSVTYHIFNHHANIYLSILCSSTIGPIIATLSGILTIDVGTPQFSMHSIREMMGSEDAFTGYVHLKSVLHNFGLIQRKSALP